MDKVDTQEWDRLFSHLDYKPVHTSDRYTEAVLTFEEAGLATGSINLISTPGMALRQVSVRCQGPLTLCDSSENEDVNSAYILSGGIESRFSNIKKHVDFKRNRHGFQYNPTFQAEHTIHSGCFEAFQISYDIPFFKNLIGSSEIGALDKVGDSIERKAVFFAPPDRLDVQPRMAEIIHAVRHCAFQGLTRYLFIEAKLMELFALQIDQMTTASQLPVKGQLSRIDIEKLNAVREFIDNNYLMPLALAQIVQRFGLNEFKLKKGYRELFNTTVFGHIHQLRMHKARQLLSQKVMNVSETADFIGYNNVSSFSAEYKKRFGHSPAR
ncbi:MAG TPA: AraC family transcriptional regulator [Fibrella sp.]